ncbi:hypothetical protein ACJ73_03297 [Blastomyces percursus]|uniref:Subtelomeric hrmA-associated cluster protein AFUB-079030/YDR124W-like helical bundle domain-containing protein n=1 Tax=Blastomyces percursus TaxID=1658174 RepID=A0A1J9R9Y8_9EURO|nr:hypothetical protein ACJ73_03297 [Blastomyces percursus]
MSSPLSRTNTEVGEKVDSSEAESKKGVNPDYERNDFYTAKFKLFPSKSLCMITKLHVAVAQWHLGTVNPGQGGARPSWWPESVDYADVDKLTFESRVVVNAHIFSNPKIQGEALEGPFKAMREIPKECEEALRKIYEKKKSEDYINQEALMSPPEHGLDKINSHNLATEKSDGTGMVNGCLRSPFSYPPLGDFFAS